MEFDYAASGESYSSAEDAVAGCGSLGGPSDLVAQLASQLTIPEGAGLEQLGNTN